MTETADVKQSVFVGQLHPNTRDRDRLLEEGVQDGEFFLSLQSAVYPLRKWRCWAPEVMGFRTKIRDGGAVTTASHYDDEVPGLEEHFVAVLIVDVNDTLFPARVDLRKINAPIIQKADTMLRSVSDGNQDAEMRKTLRQNFSETTHLYPSAWTRFVVEVETGEERISAGGFPYYPLKVRTELTPKADLIRLSTAMGEETFQSCYRMASESFQDRCQYIEGRIGRY